MSQERFYNALKDDPEAIIEWCEKEIEAYKELIELIKSKEKSEPA